MEPPSSGMERGVNFKHSALKHPSPKYIYPHSLPFWKNEPKSFSRVERKSFVWAAVRMQMLSKSTRTSCGREKDGGKDGILEAGEPFIVVKVAVG